MISPEAWLTAIQNESIEFVTGVPDSLLKNFLQVVNDRLDRKRHVICANEGGAVAAACGYYLGTKKTPLVYMQNSGLGNAVNPLISLASSGVYAIPLLLMIGWRGKPGESDEPQHMPMGAATEDVLKSLSIKYEIMQNELEPAQQQLKSLLQHAAKTNAPVALLVPAKTFAEAQDKFAKQSLESNISREEAVTAIVKELNQDDAVIASTGFIGRQLLQCRQNLNLDCSNDFLNVGAMGHTNQIALGLALAQAQRKVVCVDGDGAILMHMGGLTTIAQLQLNNYKHIVLNNGMHESVGGQPTAARHLNLTQIAKSGGYGAAERCKSLSELDTAVKTCLSNPKLSFLEILICASGDKLPRPEKSMVDAKESFLRS